MRVKKKSDEKKDTWLQCTGMAEMNAVKKHMEKAKKTHRKSMEKDTCCWSQ